MFQSDPRSPRETVAIAAVALLHVGIALLALRPSLVQLPPPETPILVSEITPPRPEPEPAPEPAKRAPRPEGEASAANKRAKPTEIVAPKPPIELPPPPVVAAPVASTGPDASAGAAAVEGPGTGAGGEGTGLGSGGQGTGTGGGGGRGAYKIKGSIRDSDYPKAASKAGVGGTVVVYFDVNPKGRVENCRVVVTSGNTDLDDVVCRLAQKRFRYRPATDAQGRPVTATIAWRQEWWLAGPS